MPTTTHPTRPWPAVARSGAIGGMIAAAMMAMYAMVASATYQHHGFFTPLFHISALTGSPSSMMRSVAEAMAGHRFWFALGAGVVGMVIHMVTGAMYGVGFAAFARRLSSGAALTAGAVYGLAVFLMSSFVGLPLAAKVSGAGAVVSEMPKMVGWGTFAVEHVLFGLVLGVWALRATGKVGFAPADRAARAVAAS